MKVSVVMITYNHERFVAQAIESTLAQNTRFDYEIIIGEDCSTDKTRQIVLDYARRYPQMIRLILPERNLGSNGARLFTKTFESAQGEYIALTDGDDYWISPHKLQRQVEFLDEHPQCSICFHNVKLRYENSGLERLKNGPSVQKKFSTLEDLWSGCFIDACSVMFRRSAIDVLPSWFDSTSSADWALYLLLAQRGLIGYMDETMAVYRKHDQGVWSGLRYMDQLERVIEFYEKVNKHFNYAYEDTISDMLDRCRFKLAEEYEKNGDFARARQAFRCCMESESPELLNHLAVRGVAREAVRRYLRTRIWLCLSPAVYRFIRPDQPVIAKSKALVRMSRNKLRRRLGRANGSISADPNPIRLGAHSQSGVTTLSWVADRAETVEVRIGTPDGQLFSRSGTTGTATTGEWVVDGMVFCLQDVSGGLPLNSDNTLDKVKVRIALL